MIKGFWITLLNKFETILLNLCLNHLDFQTFSAKGRTITIFTWKVFLEYNLCYHLNISDHIHGMHGFVSTQLYCRIQTNCITTQQFDKSSICTKQCSHLKHAENAIWRFFCTSFTNIILQFSFCLVSQMFKEITWLSSFCFKFLTVYLKQLFHHQLR